MRFIDLLGGSPYNSGVLAKIMPKNVEKIGDSAPWWQPAIVLFIRLSGWIAIPIIGAIFLGRWLDDKYNTAPWLYLGSVGIAFIITTVGIIKDATQAIKFMEEQDKDKQK
ncbi:MAG: AtpZ/AtpI family protein [Patescibacteria group bacterium]